MSRLSDHKVSIMAFGVLLITVVGVLFTLHTREPTYQGRTLSSWVEQLDDGEPWAGFSYRSWRNFSAEQAQAAEAIRSIGTNALPFLISAATRPEKPLDGLPTAIFGNRQKEREARKKRLSRSWNAALALYVLGPAAKPCLPQLRQAYFDYGNDGTARNAAVALAGIGPEGWQVLSDTITNTNWFACFGIWALANQNVQTPVVVDSLIVLLTNNVEFHSGVAAWALKKLGQEPDRVIPALLDVYSSSSESSMRSITADALASFGSKAECAVPALLEALHDSDVIIRHTATNALKAIRPESLR